MKPRIAEELERGPLRFERIRVAHARELEPLSLDPRVWRTLQDPREPPPTSRDVWRNAERKDAHWELHGFGQWLLREHKDGLVVGRGGLQYTEATGFREVEIGWAVLPERWGRGYATELAVAAIEAAFSGLGLASVIAYTQLHNHASRRVMEKAGFHYESDLLYEELAHVVYRLHAGD